MASASLLIQEPPLILLPSLAVMLGLNEALVTQQLFFMLQGKYSGVELNGEKWIWNTYDQWRDEVFPFWSTDTIRRTFDNLESMYIVESCQPRGYNRMKYYRLNKGMLCKLVVGSPSPQVAMMADDPSAQIAMMEEGKLPGSQTENTAKTTVSLSVNGLGFADWFKTLLPPDSKLVTGWRAKWAQVYDDMLRIDSRTDQQIVLVCKWARADEFWSTNFFSPLKLRKRNREGVMYFDVFHEKANTKPRSNQNGRRFDPNNAESLRNSPNTYTNG